MAKQKAKRICESKTEHVQILMPTHINGYNRLFGGRLMEWIDVVAAVVARRHCGRDVTTVAIDNLHFKEAAHVNTTMVLQGRITHVGRTSMEVRVDSYAEDIAGQRRLVNTAYLVMVALDETEHPVPVPGLVLETEQEKWEWEAGEKRQALRKQRRIEAY